MNEADTPNNGAFVELLESANSPQLKQASCPFYSVLVNENMASQLPLLAPAKDEQWETERTLENTPQQDWIAEPDSEKQAIINTEFKKLLVLNEELRSANNDLYDRVEELTTDLTESEKALQWQKKRSSVTESMLNQQTQELAAAQEQIQSLFQQLETAVQTAGRQEMLIETYKAQLEISQQRLAQLERECTLIQSNYNEQSHQLSQSENACRELRTRLMRQQRQTLQFKAALEKCLETPVPSDDSLDNNDIGSRQSRPSRRASSLVPNVQPIRPWSAEPESFTDDVDNPSKESLISTDNKQDNHASSQSTWDTSNQENTQTSAPEINHYPTTPEAVSPLGSKNLEEQLDGVIQLFFASAPLSPSPPTSTEKDRDTGLSEFPTPMSGVDSIQAAAPVWETIETPLVDDEEPEITSLLNDHNPEKEEPDATSPLNDNNPQETEDYWSEVSQLSSLELPGTALAQESTDYSIKASSPSPLVYPQRPPKGRKSLASVELPNFSPNKGIGD